MKDQKQYLDLCTKTLLFCVFSFFILFPGFHGYLCIQQSKYWCFLLLFGGYLALLVLFFAETAILGWRERPSLGLVWKKLSITQWLAILYLLLTLLSALVSPYQQDVWVGMSRNEGFWTQLLYVGCFLCLSFVGYVPKNLWKVLAGTMIVFCALCFLQFVGKNPLNLYPEGLCYYDGNSKYLGVYLGTLGNADTVASLLCMAIPIFALQILGERCRHVWLEVFALLACLVVLWKMQVSAGFVGLFAGLLLSIPAVSPGRKLPKRLQWIWVFLVFILGLACVYILPVKGTLYELQQILHGNVSDAFGSGRVGIWRQVGAEILHNPLFGTGPDTMLAGKIAGASHMINGEIIDITIDVAHNEYLNIAYHQGIPAAVVYLVFLGSLLWKWAKEPEKSRETALLGCGVLCYSIQALFSISVCMTAGVFWVLLGLLEKNLKKGKET